MSQLWRKIIIKKKESKNKLSKKRESKKKLSKKRESKKKLSKQILKIKSDMKKLNNI